MEIGRVGETCWYCGSPNITVGLGRLGPPFSWSAPVCEVHSGTPVEQWPKKEDLPVSALTPALIEWRDRHVRIGFVPRDDD